LVACDSMPNLSLLRVSQSVYQHDYEA